jgi:hypothetical protein
VQVDPIKPTLKAPGTKRLKLEYGELVSSFAFSFKLRRYTMEDDVRRYAALDAWLLQKMHAAMRQRLTLVHSLAQPKRLLCHRFASRGHFGGV